MRHQFIISLIGLSLTLGCPGPNPPEACVESQPLDPPSANAVLSQNIVQIRSDDSLGSGFLLQSDSDNGDALIVSNYHVIAEGSDFDVHFVREDGSAVEVGGVEVVKTDPKNDLALLKAPGLSAFGAGLQLGSDVSTGMGVATLGYPHIEGTRNEPVLSTGVVNSARQTINDQDFIMTDLKVISGNSGGPAVSSCGRVIGIVTAYHASEKHIGLLVPAEPIAALHKEYMTRRPPADVEVKERLESFLRHIQRDEERTASNYFSRQFYDRWVFPYVTRQVQQAIAKRQQLDEILYQLQQRGYDVDSLSEEQVERIAHEFDLDFTNEELFVAAVLKKAMTEKWNSYQLVQTVFTPFVDADFGTVQAFNVEETSDDGQTAYLTVSSNGRDRYFTFEMVYEWGTWQINGYEETNDDWQPESPPPAEHGNPEGTVTAQSGINHGEWVPVRVRR